MTMEIIFKWSLIVPKCSQICVGSSQQMSKTVESFEHSPLIVLRAPPICPGTCHQSATNVKTSTKCQHGRKKIQTLLLRDNPKISGLLMKTSYIYMCIYTCISIYIHMYFFIFIFIYIYIYIHIFSYELFQRSWAQRRLIESLSRILRKLTFSL